jgi:hypothetical protein
MTRRCSSPIALTAGLLLAGSAVHAHAQGAVPAASQTRAHVAALASERADGRLTGSPGEQVARDYLIAELKRIGARPVPGFTDFRQAFDFTAGTKDGGSTVALECVAQATACSARTFKGEQDVRALSFSDNADVSGPLVFAGYGIVVPDGQSFGYDSYAGLDVKDKIVVVLRYFPEDADQQTKAILARGDIAIHVRLKGEMSEACLGLEPKAWNYVSSLIKEGRAAGLDVYIDEPYPQIAENPPIVRTSSFSLSSLFK